MYYDRSKYESLIINSPLFEIDKATEPTAYSRESYKMIEYLYCYLLSINEHEYEPYGYEITEVATRCIRNYDASKGVFLHYFNAAWKQEFSHILGEKISDDKFHGIKIAEEDKRNIIKYLKLSERIEPSVPKNERLQLISDAMGIPIKKIESIIQMNDMFVVNDTIENEDGEAFSIIDQVSDGILIDQHLYISDSVGELLQTIEIVYDELQDRQKAMISDLITARIWSIVEELTVSKSQYHFISKDIIDEYNLTGFMPTQRQIGEKYNRDEASVSRTMKEFMKKIEKYKKRGK